MIITFEAEQRFRNGRSQTKNQRQQQERYKQSHQQGQKKNQYADASSYSAKAQLGDAFKILGVKEGDDSKLIKKAYRKQMSLHHPDKVASKGLPAQALELAKQRAQDIQAAYELVRKHKQF
jgi:DnaJ like chaperone protein